MQREVERFLDLLHYSVLVFLQLLSSLLLVSTAATQPRLKLGSLLSSWEAVKKGNRSLLRLSVIRQMHACPEEGHAGQSHGNVSQNSHLESHCVLMDKEVMLHSSSFPGLCDHLNHPARRYGLHAVVPGVLMVLAHGAYCNP